MLLLDRSLPLPQALPRELQNCPFTCVWPLYEVIEGTYTLNYMPKEKKPVEEYLRAQGRFAHMFKPGNEWMIEETQKEVDPNWEELLQLFAR